MPPSIQRIIIYTKKTRELAEFYVRFLDYEGVNAVRSSTMNSLWYPIMRPVALPPGISDRSMSLILLGFADHSFRAERFL